MSNTGKPNFLVVGAMKAGTTMLHGLLGQHPQIYMPARKEFAFFAGNPAHRKMSEQTYLEYFSGAVGYLRVGEASTQYTKKPFMTGAAAEARRLLGSDLKIIYVVRDPIARMKSHFFHEQGMPSRFSDAMRMRCDLEFYSSYWYQISDWIRLFGRDAVLCVRFEALVSRPSEEVAAICRWLGVDEGQAAGLSLEKIDENSSQSHRAVPRWLAMIAQAGAVRRYFVGHLPRGIRDRIKKLFPLTAGQKIFDTPDRYLWEGVVERLLVDLDGFSSNIDSGLVRGYRESLLSSLSSWPASSSAGGMKRSIA